MARIDYTPPASGGGSGSVATDTIFDAKGDLAAGTGADTAARLPAGSDGQRLEADSAQATGLKWATPKTVATDTVWDTKGDMVAATGADTAAKVPVGTNGQRLTADSTAAAGVSWQTPTTVATDVIFDAKGDLAVGTGADTAAKLTVGADGTTAIADSNAATGLRYVPLPGTATPAVGEIAFPAHTGAMTTQLLAQNTMYLVAVDLPKRMSFDQMQAYVNSAGTGASMVIRLGVYGDDGTGCRPSGAALFEVGSPPDPTTTGNKTPTISQTLDPGRYWLAIVAQATVYTTGPTMVACQTVSLPGGHTALPASGSRLGPWTMAGVSGALPTISGLARSTAAVPVMVALRRS